VLAQDSTASHCRYAEPTTGITFYTSTEVNGTVTGDCDMSTVSLGVFTFHVALPAGAATVNSYEYIGLIVRSFETIWRNAAKITVDWLSVRWQRMGWYSSG
jgi:cellobiose dehydrogenase (acceptor)